MTEANPQRTAKPTFASGTNGRYQSSGESLAATGCNRLKSGLSKVADRIADS
jgi:hypothetical protein